MKIVVLDGYTMNPGDLSWDDISRLGTCDIHDRTPANLTIERSLGADALLTNKTVLDSNIIRQLDTLKYIGVMATGFNVVDLDVAREREIYVTNVPAYSTMSVAQLVFALILELTSNAGLHNQSVHNGDWASCPDFCYWRTPLVELDGLTMGIVGYGRIGRAVGAIARSFGMKVLVATRSTPSFPDDGYERVSIEDIFRRGDIVSFHCPLTDETAELANRERISLMKPGAYLINTGRGGLVNERDLADALNSGTIAGAGVDVLSTEPPSPDNPLLTAKNCVITPHLAWATKAARSRLMSTVVKNFASFIDGSPVNLVNPW